MPRGRDGERNDNTKTNLRRCVTGGLLNVSISPRKRDSIVGYTGSAGGLRGYAGGFGVGGMTMFSPVIVSRTKKATRLRYRTKKF